jgi:predicted ATPase
VDWISSFGSAATESMPLSPAASASPRVVRFRDRFMRKGRNTLSGFDASEGALYVLYLAVLATHFDAPTFYAIDNADHGLNPGLANALTSAFARWIISNPVHPQVLMTSHNQAVLDGLPLQDDRVRLFAVDRDSKGRTNAS